MDSQGQTDKWLSCNQSGVLSVILTLDLLFYPPCQSQPLVTYANQASHASASPNYFQDDPLSALHSRRLSFLSLMTLYSAESTIIPFMVSTSTEWSTTFSLPIFQPKALYTLIIFSLETRKQFKWTPSCSRHPIYSFLDTIWYPATF